MANCNSVYLRGNLTRDPELRYLPSGLPVSNFGLAVPRRFRRGDEWQEEVCFVDIVVFGRQAEVCGEALPAEGEQHLRGGPPPVAELGDGGRDQAVQARGGGWQRPFHRPAPAQPFRLRRAVGRSGR